MESAKNREKEIVKKQTLSDNEADDPNVSDEQNIVVTLNKNNLIQGLIMSEILARPRAIKSRGNYIWNSRF